MEHFPISPQEAYNIPEKQEKFETITLEIEEKKYEVHKSHFTYPEYLQKENGGVEGYDRFELSWKDFDKEQLDEVRKEINSYKKYDNYKELLHKQQKDLSNSINSKLSKISDRLNIGTDMQNETINHSVYGIHAPVNRGIEWNDNKFFLNKPFDLEDFINVCEKTGEKPYTDMNWSFYKDGKVVDFVEYMRKFSPNYIKQYGNDDSRKKFNAEAIAEDLLDLDYSKMREFMRDKDIITNGMSFNSGSNLNLVDKEFHQGYETPFFNFNNRNNAFKKYVENLNKINYHPNLRKRESGKNSHPKLSMAFTKEFPAFNWAMADTGYVPMKEGPNFFRFYSKE